MRRRVTLATLATATVAFGVPLSAVAHAADPSRVGVPAAQPSWVASAQPSAAAPAATRIDIKVNLANRNAAELDALVEAVTDPHSAQYGQYLSPDQFRARFSPSDSDLSRVTSWLTGAGLQIAEIPDNRSYVLATGTVAQAQRAFQTTLSTYRHVGRNVRAASAPVTVPATLSGLVTGVSGLADPASMTTPDSTTGKNKAATTSPATTSAAGKTVSPSAPPPAGFRNAKPCSSFYGQKLDTTDPSAYGQRWPYVVCGYTPAQLQGGYGISQAVRSGVDGRGVTVAITDAYAAPTILADANKYATSNGQPAFRRGQFRQVLPKTYQYGYDDTVNGDQCGEQGWYGEETLDVEAVHAMAPGADVVYVAASSCMDNDFQTALNKIVDKHLADIVTNSWGDTGEPTDAATIQAYEQTFKQGAVEGIGFYFSTGDDGDDSTVTDNGSPAVNFPASDPWATGVGGTSIGIGARNNYQFETGWATGKSVLTGGTWDPALPGKFWGGTGGGTSSVFKQPWYQRGVVPARIATRNGGTKRATPDVAMDADPNTGMLVGETQTFPDGAYYDTYRIGGTSLASPLMAGMMALADQVSGRPHGFANPALYALAGLPVLHDVSDTSTHAEVRVDYANSVDSSAGLVTSLRTLKYPQTISVAPGYDDMTGVGSPNGVGFLAFVGHLRR